MTDLGRTRTQIVAGLAMVSTMAVAWIVAGRRSEGWATVFAAGRVLVMLGLLTGAVVSAVVRRAGRPRLATTGSGYAPVPAISPAILVTSFGFALFQVLVLFDGLGRASWSVAPMTVALGLMVSLITWASWRFPVELTSEGIRMHWVWLRRTIPWDALSGGGSVFARGNRLELVVTRPDLVVQRGWEGGLGTRERPELPAVRHHHLVAAAIGWYVAHPEDRAAIGAPAELERLAGVWSASPPGPLPLPAPVPPRVRPGRSAPTRPVRIAVTLAYVATAIAVFAAGAAVFATSVLRADLLAAERTLAASEPPPPGEVSFSTDTADFARGWAIAVLVATIVVGLAVVGLAWNARRGVRVAQTGLACVALVAALLNVCPTAQPSTSLAEEDAAGPLLHAWLPAESIEAVVVLALGATIFALVLAGQDRPAA